MTRLAAHRFLPAAARRAALAVALAAGACQGPADRAIGLYQDHVGPQWGFHCDFQPSCSTYGREAVEQFGFLKGSLMTADRLMRDHTLALHQYSRTAAGHPFDPVQGSALFASARPLPPADDPAALEQEIERLPPASAAEQLRFADSLFEAREYDRARIEYLRLLFHHPAAGEARRARGRLIACLAETGRYREALLQVEALPAGPGRDLHRALVQRAAGQPETAARTAADGTPEGQLLSGFLHLEAGEAGAAEQRFQALDEPPRGQLLESTRAFRELPSRSPVLAGSLSALLPGSGQIYSGSTADGIVAFLTNSILIGATVAAAHNDEGVAAGALGAVAFGFYAGNVYGGANAAARFNSRHREEFLGRARGRLRQSWPTLGLSARDEGGALSIYFRF